MEMPRLWPCFLVRGTSWISYPSRLGWNTHKQGLYISARSVPPPRSGAHKAQSKEKTNSFILSSKDAAVLRVSWVCLSNRNLSLSFSLYWFNNKLNFLTWSDSYEGYLFSDSPSCWPSAGRAGQGFWGIRRSRGQSLEVVGEVGLLTSDLGGPWQSAWSHNSRIPAAPWRPGRWWGLWWAWSRCEGCGHLCEVARPDWKRRGGQITPRSILNPPNCHSSFMCSLITQSLDYRLE